MVEAYAARLLGVVEGCTNPESAELLVDDETFVFGNCALRVGIPSFRAGAGVVYLQGEAFVSRARISAAGDVSLDARTVVGGLTGTLGCDVVRGDGGVFAKGTVLMVEGGDPITTDGGQSATSLWRSRVIAFDPGSGELLAEIPLGAGSVLASVFNPISQPNGCAVDIEGNLYFSDIPNSNPDPDPAAAPPVPPAVYRIPAGSIPRLIAGEPGGADDVRRVEMPGYVNGVTVSPVDGTCWAVSCSPVDPVNGGLYHLTSESFQSGRQPDPDYRDLGILDGVGVTRRGTVMASNPLTGEIHAFSPGGRHRVFRADPVQMPADFNVVYPTALGGEPAVLVPDISMGRDPGSGIVAVLAIEGL